MALKVLKQCTKIRKYAVFGFIRETSNQLLLQHIPTMINYVCLSYYSPNTDFFDKCSNGNNTKVSIDQLTVICTCEKDSTWISVFGYHLIESLTSKTREWIFKIIGMSTISPGGIAIGLERYNKDTTNAFCTSGKNYSVGIYGKDRDIFKAYDGFGSPFYEHNVKFFQDLTEGSKVKLTLQKAELTISVNDHIVFDAEKIKIGEDIKYMMGVAIAGKSNSVVLEKYTESQ